MDPNKRFFGSSSYEVPLDQLYTCGIDSNGSHFSASSGCDDFDEDESVCASDDQKVITSSSSDDSDWEVYIPSGRGRNGNSRSEIISAPSVDDSLIIQTRPSRNRRRPDRYGGSTSYDCDTPFAGENDTVQNYWPNYPRGSWPLGSTAE